MTLLPLPPTFAETRDALHGVAVRVVSPAREAVTGRIGLRATPGGFGTPPFGDDGRRVRVEGDELVTEAGGTEVAREPLDVDAAASRALGAFYGFVASVLEDLAEERLSPSEIQLWPEHFDIAVELGDEAAGTRANYGGSPGDEHHDGPYLYVSPWIAPAPSDYWNARGFPGAELSYSQLLAADDPRAAALAFYRRGLL